MRGRIVPVVEQQYQLEWELALLRLAVARQAAQVPALVVKAVVGLASRLVVIKGPQLRGRVAAAPA